MTTLAPPTTTDAYRAFLAGKRIVAQPAGFEVADADIPAALFPFQRQILRWALHRGRAAIFADCGLGKTPMQLAWAGAAAGAVAREMAVAPGGQTAGPQPAIGVPPPATAAYVANLERRVREAEQRSASLDAALARALAASQREES